MNRLIILACVIAASAGQLVDDRHAKIIKEQRFNAGDGRAGAAYATENGQIFREEASADGSRIGQYSYIGDDGKTYTVKYSAGKEGFRILSGDHIPSGGQEAAAFVRDPDAQIARVAEPALAPQQPIQRAQLPAAPRPVQRPVQAPLPQQPEFRDYELYDDEPVDPNFNPFINPHDPTHRNFQFNKNAASFDPNNPLSRQQSLVPNCADCENVNPFINPFDASHQSGGVLAGHLAGLGQARPAPARRPVQPQQPAARGPPVQPLPTQAPAFFPPGQLQLNRFEDGFNFDFSS